uniref:Uncharacterized protein n=1 Tax=Arundo donax TaxID=35708 RepID=A0A0A9E0H2_ARUDO
MQVIYLSHLIVFRIISVRIPKMFSCHQRM